MTQLTSVPVQIGQVKIGREGHLLNAILGSCIGIGFLHPTQGIYGLAHALLAKSDGPTLKGRGRHVDQAIQSLLKMMDIRDEDRRKVRVVLTGGANMTMPPGTDPKRLVGSSNAGFARKAVRASGLRITHEDLGGENGRRIKIDCTQGSYAIEAIPRLKST
ncbi:MAG: chemotaxis protein CheD [Pseudomonadota bacterium]